MIPVGKELRKFNQSAPFETRTWESSTLPLSHLAPHLLYWNGPEVRLACGLGEVSLSQNLERHFVTKQREAYLGVGNGNVVFILIPYALAFYKSYNSYPELISICNISFSVKAFRSNFSVPNSLDPNQ